MRKVKLSKRLKKVAGFVKEDELILDIGSDHAHLPIYLIQENLIPAAIAGELVQNPYKTAVKEIARYNLTDKISIRLGSGLDVLEVEEKMGSIFICGMGGFLISNIVEKGLKDKKIGKDTRLILQANKKEKELRKSLAYFGFEIIKEAIVKENNKYYEIIVATRKDSKISYNENELIFGPRLLEKRSQLFIEKWTKTLRNNQQILKKLNQRKHSTKKEELRKLNQKIKKVIK